ncbi:1759_t:CDS:2 [Ambispora gerdemannii]|uniref:1759_t:CDS:1 n=1 Tax=Ambispora gerdemannii TaxID=144530 RepID=A0A9N8YMT5_9GLOM|nr:1759_t:CDS:2 [Ambispora gerdemannii]
MSSSEASPSSKDFKNSLNETAWEEGMVTPQQLSVTDSAASQLDPVSIFYSAASISSTNANATHSLDAKNDISTELDASVAPTNDRFFTFENLFDVEDLGVSSSVTENNDLFSTSTAAENLNRTSTESTSYVTSPRTIQPVMLTNMNTSVSSPVSESVTSPDTPQSPDESTSGKKKQNGGRKRKAESLEEKEARARERVLRNRHAAQMSRDKKRRQLADLESQNALLKEDNIHLSKRIKLVEEENVALSIKLETISTQLAEIQSHLAVSEVTKLLLDGVRGSAASATLEKNTLALNDEVPAAARQVEEPLRDVDITNSFLSDLDVPSSNTESTVADLLDSFLDYDWSAEVLSPIQQQQKTNGIC